MIWLSWLDTGISIKCGGVKLVLGVQTSPLGKVMRSCQSFPHVRMKVLDYYTQLLWLLETNLFLFVYREFDDVENSRYIRFHNVLCEGALVTSCWGSLLLNSSFWWGPCCSFLYFCCVLVYVFTFWVRCCDVRYDYRIKTMFGSSLSPAVCRRAHALFILLVFVCVKWCPTHIVLCVC